MTVSNRIMTEVETQRRTLSVKTDVPENVFFENTLKRDTSLLEARDRRVERVRGLTFGNMTNDLK